MAHISSKAADDHPNIIVFPPVVLATTVVLGSMLQWLLPLGQLAAVSHAWRIVIGSIAILAGISLAATGRRLLTRLGTNVSPLRPTTALATGGVYRWTRNPLYTGGTFVLVGIALIFALDWLALLMVPALLVLHFGVVRREEQYLEHKFGDTYRQYKASVARYGFGI
jgi:protein-S-isoprenylcysteine O-methyltransferase Ste14